MLGGDNALIERDGKRMAVLTLTIFRLGFGHETIGSIVSRPDRICQHNATSPWFTASEICRLHYVAGIVNLSV